MSETEDSARVAIQAVVDAAARNPRSGEYIGCQHHRMKAAVAVCEDWLKLHPSPTLATGTVSIGGITGTINVSTHQP